jgi:pimeloyl-ACP methyl ester carboxylesterase
MQSTHHIELPGDRTLVAHTTPGDGTPVVLLHGLYGSGLDWAPVASGLSQPTVAFDLAGFGGSAAPLRAELASYAQDLADGLDTLGIDRFELVGHSFGGAVAASLAELLGDRVVALTLLAPAGFGRIALAAVGSRVCRGPEREATRAIASPAGYSYAGPVTALWGSRDRVVSPAHAMSVSASFPQAAIHVLDGGDHHLVSGSREAVVELLRTGRTPRRARRERTRRARRLLIPGFPRFVPRFA